MRLPCTSECPTARTASEKPEGSSCVLPGFEKRFQRRYGPYEDLQGPSPATTAVWIAIWYDVAPRHGHRLCSHRAGPRPIDSILMALFIAPRASSNTEPPDPSTSWCFTGSGPRVGLAHGGLCGPHIAHRPCHGHAGGLMPVQGVA